MNDSFQGITDTNNYLMPGSGRPWQQQYQINETHDTDITGWITDTHLPVKLMYPQVIVTKNKVYLLGGCTYNGCNSTVYIAPINSDGTLGAWSVDISLPRALALSQVIATKNRVYLLGGWSGNQPTNVVYTAPINDNGTLGTWVAGTPLPEILSHSQAIVTKNRVYLLGGWSGNQPTNVVYTATINTDGTLGEWSNGTPLPEVLSHSQAIVTKNRVYLLGGCTNNDYTSIIYTASINADGILDNWTCAGLIPAAIGASQAFITKNKVYLIGGLNNNSALSSVYYANINIDGTLGVWSVGTPLPNSISCNSLFVINNKIYLVGGYDNYLIKSTVYSANISGGLNDYSPYYNE